MANWGGNKTSQQESRACSAVLQPKRRSPRRRGEQETDISTGEHEETRGGYSAYGAPPGEKRRDSEAEHQTQECLDFAEGGPGSAGARENKYSAGGFKCCR